MARALTRLTSLTALTRSGAWCAVARSAEVTGLSLADLVALLFFAEYWTAGGPGVLYSDTFAEIPISANDSTSDVATMNSALYYGAL